MHIYWMIYNRRSVSKRGPDLSVWYYRLLDLWLCGRWWRAALSKM